MGEMSSEAEQSKLTGKEIGNYILTEKLGQGSLTEVWKAHHQVLNTDVVVEFLAEGLAGVPEVEERFFNEGKKQGRLFHPNIVSGYDFLKMDGRTYLVRKFIAGETLEKMLSHWPTPRPLEQVFGIASDVLHALDYAHTQGVVHGNLKPSNILVERGGKALVLDFGMALVTRPSGLTVSSAVGDVPYMSPEQVTGTGAVDGRADIYGVGCILYEILTGKLAFEALAAAAREAGRKPAPLRWWDPQIPGYLETVVLRCLEKNPADRFASCKEVLQALQPPPVQNIPAPHTDPGRMTSIEPAEPAPAVPSAPLLQPRATLTPRPTSHPPTQAIPPAAPRAEIPPPVAPQPAPSAPQPTVAPAKDSSVLWIVCTLALSASMIGGFYWFTHRPKPGPAPIIKPNPSPAPEFGKPKPFPGQTETGTNPPDGGQPENGPSPAQPGENNPGQPAPQQPEQPVPQPPAPQRPTPQEPTPDNGPSANPAGPTPAPSPAPSEPSVSIPKPAPAQRQYAKEGNLIWSGMVDKNQVVQISGSSANVGKLVGDPFPGGVPIQVSINNQKFAVISQPNPLNQFSQVSLRSTMKGNVEVTIHWTVLTEN
jgi:serine/threonine-protein kinase